MRHHIGQSILPLLLIGVISIAAQYPLSTSSLPQASALEAYLQTLPQPVSLVSSTSFAPFINAAHTLESRRTTAKSDNREVPEDLIERFIALPAGERVPLGLRSVQLIASEDFWNGDLAPANTKVVISPIALSDDGSEAVFAAMRVGPSSARTGLVYLKFEQSGWRVFLEIPWAEM